jgi:hypothetical protein
VWPLTMRTLKRDRRNLPAAGTLTATVRLSRLPALSLSVRANLPWRAATLLFSYRGIVVPQATFTFQPGAAEVEHPHTGQVTVKCSLP